MACRGARAGYRPSAAPGSAGPKGPGRTAAAARRTCARTRGTLAVAGIYLSDIPSLNYQKHLFQERQLRSVTSNTRADAREFLGIAAEHHLAVTVHPYPLDADQALRDLKADCFDGAAVLIP